MNLSIEQKYFYEIKFLLFKTKEFEIENFKLPNN